MNRQRLLMAALIIFISANTAKAACDAVGNFTVNPGNITVQRDVATGQPMTDWYYSNEAVSYRKCNYDSQLQYRIENGIKSYNGRSSGLSYNGETVLDTNLRGVGVIFQGRTRANSGNWTQWQGFPSGSVEQAITKIPHNRQDWPIFENQARIRLIKTGNIQPGILSGTASYFITGIRETNSWNPELPVTFSGGQVNTLACTMSTPDVMIALGEYKKSDFNGPGSASNWKDFNIDLNCDQNARINVRVNATADPLAIVDGVMQLDKASGDLTAAGVGIQLGYRSGSAVQFGQEKYYWTSTSGGFENIQLRARYYQTAQTIMAGKANGTATLTLTYK
jgi:type 1 fimbria pilin